MGNGTFYETAPQVLTWRNRPRADTHGGSWADFDNDGDQDLLVSAGTGNLSQLLVNEYGRLVDRTVERGLTTANLGGRLPVWLDYDGDKLTDFVMTQYGGIAKLYRQSPPGFFTETTSDAKLLCKRFHYGQLIDVTGDGRVDLLCSDEELFPQKIYNTLPFPWKKVFDNTAPAPYLPRCRSGRRLDPRRLQQRRTHGSVRARRRAVAAGRRRTEQFDALRIAADRTAPRDSSS